ncbi:MAG: hypothetical protein AB8D78_15275 [Akkermansiaceae bacterium]
MKNPFLAASAVICLASSSQAITVFSDTFNHGSGAGTFPLGTNIGPRQAGGTTSSTYTGSTAGSGGNNTLLNTNNGLEVLLLRTFNVASGVSQSAVDLDTNFASALAGNKYSISMTNVNFQRSSSTITDIWMALSIGDTSTGINGPNSGLADFGLLLRAQATGSRLWQDNVNATGFDLTGSGASIGANNGFDSVVVTIDETAGGGSATAMVEATTANGTFTSSVLNIDFDNSTHRFLELRAHQGAAGTNGQLMDMRFDSLAIDVIVPIPEPSTAMLGVLGSLLLFRRRR